MAQTRTSICRMDKKAFRKDARTGYLHAKVNPTKAGIFLYRDSETGKIVRELRSRREVHKADSRASLEHKPFGDDHPDELLDSTTAKAWATGMVVGKHDIAPDGLHTEAEVIVMDEDHIKKIEAGKEAVSCGYECDIIDKPGKDPEFGEYDREQVNIKYDHLANVHRGRAGAGAKLRADADVNPRARFDAEEIEPDEPPKSDPQTKEKPRYMLHRVDGHDVDMSEAAIEAYKAEQVKRDNALRDEKARADQAEQKLTETATKIEQLQAKVDAAEKIDIDALVAERSQAREALKAKAVKAGVKADGLEALSDREIKVQIIKSRLDFSDAELKDRKDDYLDTLVDVASKTKAAPARKDARDAYDGAGASSSARETLDGHDLDKDPMSDDF